MMKLVKKLYMSVLTLITVVCIIIGSLTHLAGVSFGKEKADTTDTKAPSGMSFTKVIDEDIDGAITSIAIDADIANVKIEVGSDKTHINYTTERDTTCEYAVKDSELTVKQKEYGKKSNASADGTDLVITIPASLKLEKIDIDTDLGGIQITNDTSDSFTCVDLQADTDLGTIEADHVIVRTAKLGSSLGDVNCKSVGFSDKLDLRADLGDIRAEFEDSLVDASMHLEISLGSIRINGREQEKKVDIKSSGERTLTIEGSLGDIDVDYQD